MCCQGFRNLVRRRFLKVFCLVGCLTILAFAIGVFCVASFRVWFPENPGQESLERHHEIWKAIRKFQDLNHGQFPATLDELISNNLLSQDQLVFRDGEATISIGYLQPFPDADEFTAVLFDQRAWGFEEDPPGLVNLTTLSGRLWASLEYDPLFSTLTQGVPRHRKVWQAIKWYRNSHEGRAPGSLQELVALGVLAKDDLEYNRRDDVKYNLADTRKYGVAGGITVHIRYVPGNTQTGSQDIALFDDEPAGSTDGRGPENATRVLVTDWTGHTGFVPMRSTPIQRE